MEIVALPVSLSPCGVWLILHAGSLGPLGHGQHPKILVLVSGGVGGKGGRCHSSLKAVGTLHRRMGANRPHEGSPRWGSLPTPERHAG